MSDNPGDAVASEVTDPNNSENGSETVVPCLSMTFINQNPNHKFRFSVPDPETEGFIYVADLGFVKKDDSVYLIPHLTREYTLRVPDAASGQVTILEMRPGEGLHLSLHESGAINLTAGRQRVCLRQPQPKRFREGKLVDIAVNAVTALPRATIEEVNSLPVSCKNLPLMGLSGFDPLYLSIYRVAEGSPWTMPALSDTMQLHVQIRLRGKSMNYHFVMWQNSSIPPRHGDVSFWV